MKDSLRLQILMVAFAICGVTMVVVAAARGANSDAEIEREFKATVQPFLATYCVNCHSGANAAAQLNLSTYSSVATVIDNFPHWNRILGRLEAGEMPPVGMPQPSPGTRKQIADWIRAVRVNEASKRDGDPGIVLARRLSNSEYDYTIRDLTGQDIRPAREFPVDPANQAGFDNSGESLDMSPALLSKYLMAAREVADHMYLTPQGFEFAPYPMLVETDRDKFSVERIVAFYHRQNTDYASYFQAAWRFKYRVNLGQPKATLAQIAAQAKVSPKYLATVWQALNTKETVGPMAKLQRMWLALPVPANGKTELAAEGSIKMREFVERMRKDTFTVFTSPTVPAAAPPGPNAPSTILGGGGLSSTSQPLMNMRNREFATHRRDFDRTALRADTPVVAPAPVAAAPAPAGRGGAGPGRGARPPSPAQLALQSRMENPDLVVPSGQLPVYEAAFARFSSVFPDTFYVEERGLSYPYDSDFKGRLLSSGFHLVQGYTRDDAPLMELVLNEKEQKELNRLWDEFEFISDYTAKTFIEFFFNQSGEVDGRGKESGSARPPDHEVTAEAVVLGLKAQYLAKAEGFPSALKAIEAHFDSVNTTIRGAENARLAAEPKHLESLVKFAARAYRRPITSKEREDLLAFYRSVRDKGGLSHEEAMRDSIVMILMSPAFCYRLDLVNPPKSADNNRGPANNLNAAPPRGRASSPVSIPATVPLTDYALANRLSYFLWSSMPDEKLLAHAAAGDLTRPAVLAAETRRMLKDERAIALATEFGGNWLGFRRFEGINTVDRDRFPSFDNDLRSAMFQEPIRFISDLVRNNGSILNMLYGKYTFVNPVLAKHYGMPAVNAEPNQWVRVNNAADFGRGGLLPMAVFMTQNSPGLRTSPVKRGHWLVLNVLGEVIPPPPPAVPELPKDEATMDLPLREVLALHRANPLCGGCHAHFDVFGLSMEGFGPIGEKRANDLAGRPVDTQATFPGGTQGTGISGLQSYIRANREKDFLENISSKLLVYAIGRSLQISDEPLVARMNAKLTANGYRIDSLVNAIVTSPQFLRRRNPDLGQRGN